jgi:hypothetical protein
MFAIPAARAGATVIGSGTGGRFDVGEESEDGK